MCCLLEPDKQLQVTGKGQFRWDIWFPVPLLMPATANNKQMYPTLKSLHPKETEQGEWFSLKESFFPTLFEGSHPFSYGCFICSPLGKIWSVDLLFLFYLACGTLVRSDGLLCWGVLALSSSMFQTLWTLVGHGVQNSQKVWKQLGMSDPSGCYLEEWVSEKRHLRQGWLLGPWAKNDLMFSSTDLGDPENQNYILNDP